MVVRQRAIQVGDKHLRYHAILNAAERVLLRLPGGVANMAAVAHEAGLAKGTVYLYFASKEELLLALHERNIDGYFQALIALLDDRATVNIKDVFEMTRATITASPLFLPLASRSFGMDQNVSAAAARAFNQRMAERLELAGAGLERHFAALTSGDGPVLLRHICALILGLWQMAGTASTGLEAGIEQPASPVIARDYSDELERAMSALWEGTLAAAARLGAKK
jgi:AcrR family transcriptional regulator